MTNPPVLATRNLGLDIGGAKIVADVSLEVAEGELLGIIGPNGAGKTTLFRSIAVRTRVARRHSRSVPPSADSAARRAFSSTVSNGKTLDTWNVRPSPSRVRRNVGCSVMSRPRSSIRPAVGR